MKKGGSEEGLPARIPLPGERVGLLGWAGEDLF